MNTRPVRPMLVAFLLIPLAGWPATELRLPMADGPFQPTDESLRQYQCPEWFRDAKLGIWSHWGPVAAPGGFGGNWYARQMYVQGSRENLHHVATRGHPSKFGYKDVIELWKAEKFDPDRLMDLYVKAGAKYFVSMGAHHDNFDLWNSKHQEWNAVNHGPKKDIVGLWRDAARKRGLRFGVSEHFARSYNWMQRSHGSDTNGPMAGVPYDGADPKYERLYGPPHGDRSAGYPTNPPASWTREWFDRMQDLVHAYQPDLVYSDGGIPFGDIGRSFMADFYNTNLKANGGRLEAVYTIKKGRDVGDYVEGVAIQDEENSVLAGIKDQPWQTDASIGTWFFVPDLEPRWRRSGPDVIVMLADIVAKNGNLLLNIPQRGDGTIDAEAEQVLADLAAWTQVNGEAIFATRPWKVLGEGPALTNATRGIKRATDYTADDIRFTRSKDGATLYAIALGWPAGGKLAVRSLAQAAGPIRTVQLLGHTGALAWTQGVEALEVTLPAERPCATAFTLKISGVGAPTVAAWDRSRILAAADAALACAPISITQHRAPLSEGGPNDFFSMSDYYWPDPAKPDGKPFVQRDGQSYPGLFNEHRQAVMGLRDAVAALAAAHQVTGEARYVAKAAELLRVFFVEPATRMNPNLEHAQVIVGKATPGRGIGIIDTLHLAEVAVAIRALEGSPAFPPELMSGLRSWFRDYIAWLRDSDRGKNEAKMTNNHAVAFWLQVAAFCQVAPDAALLAECRRQFKEVFVAVQMAEDGSFPLELKRTKPYAYSIFQLDNLASLCQLLSTPEDNLWTFELPDGRGMRKAMAYLYPYLADKSAWPRPPDVMAWEAWPVRQSSLLFAGAALGEPRYLELWRRLKPDPGDFEIRRNNAVTQPLLWMP